MRAMTDAAARSEARSEAGARPTRQRKRPRSAQEVRDRRRRILTWVLSTGLGALMVNSIVGENGYLATVRVEREQRVLLADVARLRIENQSLLDQSRRLQSDPDALEETARRELSLMKPGETLIIVKPVPTNAPAAK